LISFCVQVPPEKHIKGACGASDAIKLSIEMVYQLYQCCGLNKSTLDDAQHEGKGLMLVTPESLRFHTKKATAK